MEPESDSKMNLELVMNSEDQVLILKAVKSVDHTGKGTEFFERKPVKQTISDQPTNR
jgi:hypothetical protein